MGQKKAENVKKKICIICEFCKKPAAVVNTDWHIAGCGETLQRIWECKKCGKIWREVYIYSCLIDDETGTMF